MRIAEIYQSVQGEGLLTGTESIFVRASGCNLRCVFCDTPYASWHPEGDDLSVASIVGQITSHQAKHVVLTGGEPMLFSEIVPLCDQLRRFGCHITIETAGTLYLPLDCDLMSISPKTSNSTPSPTTEPKWHVRHEQTRHAPHVIRRLVNEYSYQFKFVIQNPTDIDEVEKYLAALVEIDRDRVLLMPQATDTATQSAIGQWLEDYCRQNALQYCPRRHIEWYGLERAT